jgi:hypothetical protein
MKITINVLVTESNWKREAPKAAREIEVVVPDDALFLHHIQFGNLVTDAIVSAIREYTSHSNPTPAPAPVVAEAAS